jgi:DNA polymerase III subunit epsilon
MRLQHRYALTLAGFVLLLCALIGGWAALLWQQLGHDEGEALGALLAARAPYLGVLVVLLALGSHWVMAHLFRQYARAALRMAEETDVILSANPEHRIAVEGGPELAGLAERINALADRNQRTLREVETRVEAAQDELAQERNRLAALISELAEGVIVCNAEGRILLYNPRARRIIQRPDEVDVDGADPGVLVGLGRSLYALLDPAPIAHALETLRHRRERGEPAPHLHFVTHTRAGRLLRLGLAPVFDPEGLVTGFVLTLDDVTRRIEADRRRDALLGSLIEGVRASLASIRAASETIEAFPTMEAEQLRRFQGIIRDESLALSERLDTSVAENADYLRSELPLEEMLGSDLLAALERSFATWAGVRPRVRHASDALWLRVDSHSLVLGLTHLIRRLQEEEAVEEAILDLERAERYARLDLIWNGHPPGADTLRRWQHEPAVLGGQQTATTLADVVERHGSVAWSQFDPTTGRVYFRLFLPLAPPERTGEPATAIGSRPEYYDFDLFARAGPVPELDATPLLDLAYTVFDTETTGLNPSEGDELIAIGAARIINGRLLRVEIFDQRINPRRPISPESQAVHGISNRMLEDEPPLEVVLPRFWRFAEDTVLVAHNAAFDMRFLQLAEARARTRFAQPVLDTLLLSAVVQPEQQDHRLEAIAARLGVPVIGRHTSLGDAVVTGQVFLKLLPMLAARGITTLGAAREACQQTLLARVRY